MRREAWQPGGPRYRENISFTSGVWLVLGQLSLMAVRKQSSAAWPNNLQPNRTIPPSPSSTLPTSVGNFLLDTTLSPDHKQWIWTKALKRAQILKLCSKTLWAASIKQHFNHMCAPKQHLMQTSKPIKINCELLSLWCRIAAYVVCSNLVTYEVPWQFGCCLRKLQYCYCSCFKISPVWRTSNDSVMGKTGV